MNFNIKNMLQGNQKIIIIFIIIVVVFIVAYYLTHSKKTGRKISNLEKNYTSNISYQTDYCSDNLKHYKLFDFHVLSSANTFITGVERYDYLSLKMLEKVLYYGARYIELEIYNKDGLNDSEPVISYGKKEGNWKLTYNYLNALDVFKVITDNAFSETFIQNRMDPLFVFLNIKTNGNLTSLDKLHDIIISTCNQYLLDKRYRKEKMNIANTPVCNLMNKIVFFSNDNYQGSKLEDLINLSTKGPYLQRIPYSELITKSKFNLEKPEVYLKSKNISFHAGYTYDYISVDDYTTNLYNLGLNENHVIKIDGAKTPENNTGTNLLKIRQITKNKIVIADRAHNLVPENKGSEISIRAYTEVEDKMNLDIRNKKMLTIVYPDYNFFTMNYPPKTAWFNGCQFAALNFHKPDKYMEQNMRFFDDAGIKLKISSLRNNTDFRPSKNEYKNSLRQLYPLPEKPKKYDINYEFLNNYINEVVYISTLLGDNIRLKAVLPYSRKYSVNPQNMANITIDFDNLNTRLKIVKGLSGRENTISFKIQNPKIPRTESFYLGINNDKKLVSVRQPIVPEITSFSKDQKKVYNEQLVSFNKFAEKCSFFPLNPACIKKGYVSFGIEMEAPSNTNLETQATTMSSQSQNIFTQKQMALYYLKYIPSFNPKNKLYVKNQSTLRRIMKIENNEGNSITIWRPIKDNGFYPLGDYASISDINENIYNFTNSNYAKHIYTVKGAVEKPIDYDLVWKGVKKEETAGNMDKEEYISIWKPVPLTGYTSLGYVFNNGFLKPSLDTVRCVKTTYLKEVPSSMFMTFGELISSSNNSMLLPQNIDDALESEYKMYNLLWNNKYKRNVLPFTLLDNPVSRNTVKPLSIWNLNLRDSNDFNFNESNDIIFNYNIPYNIYFDGTNMNEMRAPVKFNYPVFMMNNRPYYDDKITADVKINTIPDKNATCFKVTKIYVDESATPFTDTRLLNNLSKIKRYNGKIVSFQRNNYGNKMCLSLPQSYWSRYYDNRFSNDDPQEITSDLNFENCKTDKHFGSDWIYDENDKTIRLQGNKDYCVTANYNNIDPNTDLSDPNNIVKLKKCNTTQPGQEFIIDNLHIKSYYGKDTGKCIFHDPENLTKMLTCENRYRMKFNFSGLDQDYCFNIPSFDRNNNLYIKNNTNFTTLNQNILNSKYGSVVYILHKFNRVIKQNTTPQIVPPVIDNPLNEQFDFLNFHVYVRGCILHEIVDLVDTSSQIIPIKKDCLVVLGLNNDYKSIIDTSNIITLKPKYLEYENYTDSNGNKISYTNNNGTMEHFIRIKKDSSNMILAIPVKEHHDLQIGTWALAPNGEVNSTDNFIVENSCCFKCKIVEKVNKFNYRVIFSINSIEPRKKYQSLGRPSINDVKTIHISKLFVIQSAPIC